MASHVILYLTVHHTERPATPFTPAIPATDRRQQEKQKIRINGTWMTFEEAHDRKLVEYVMFPPSGAQGRGGTAQSNLIQGLKLISPKVETVEIP